ncbi:MAG: CoA-binding protein [Deltaproteobacteria bacterium]|nr:CoA-binding protein [Deltaproteobacteria bacterium]
MKQKVAVLGASSNPERYSNKAIRMLLKYGHEVYPIHPLEKQIENLKTFSNLNEISEKLDTITVYVGPKNISPLIEAIVSANPNRVIANPGAESDELKEALASASIPYIEACTLVLLQTKQF